LGIVFIFFLTDSPEKGSTATARTESASCLFERALLAKPFSADHATLQEHLIAGGSADEAKALLQC
jgi:hypothetical protein